MRSAFDSNPSRLLRERWLWATTLLRDEALRGRLTRGVIWSTAGSGMLQGFTLIASFPLARILGKAPYGELGIVQATIATFAVFAGPTIGLTANTYVAQLRDADPKRAARILSLTSAIAVFASALFAVALAAAAEPLATTVLRAPTLVTGLRVGALALFLTGIDSAQRGALAGFEEFRALALIGATRGVATLPAMLLLAWRFHLVGAVAGIAVTAAIEALINQRVLRACRRRFAFSAPGRDRWREWRAIVHFSVPALLGGAVTLPAAWIASALIARRPGGYSELGVFNAATNWRNAILFLPVVLNQPFLSVLSHSFGARDIRRFWRVFRINLVVTALSAIIAGALVMLGRGHIMSAYGSGFGVGGPVLVMLVFAAILSAAVSPIGSAISSTGRMWHGAFLNCLWAIALIAAAWLLRNRGAAGLAAAWCAAGCVHLVTSSTYVLFLRRSELGSGDRVASALSIV